MNLAAWAVELNPVEKFFFFSNGLATDLSIAEYRQIRRKLLGTKVIQLDYHLMKSKGVLQTMKLLREIRGEKPGPCTAARPNQ